MLFFRLILKLIQVFINRKEEIGTVDVQIHTRCKNISSFFYKSWFKEEIACNMSEEYPENCLIL